MDNSDKWSPLHRVRKAVIDSRPSTRLIKSHVPRDLLPVSILETNCKIIYVYRNVKDVMVSLFYMSKGLWEYQHTSPHDNFEHFVEKFVTGQIVFGPYFQHLASFWPHRHDANILLISYESILKDPQAMIKKLAAFMGNRSARRESRRSFRLAALKK
ncbi:putative Sulfotransferase 1 family member D1 [Hypsibius exemplaris]|uniref:Sulfotransferase 1 family member D1 n=1 Tax=Hypsibius exemplaris TaxID=2072580 RepID=A0A1W0WHA7_HYPEX|nr:putative Sulfotransferase 1 family member D1 [Hypsibius exemplaris]